MGALAIKEPEVKEPEVTEPEVKEPEAGVYRTVLKEPEVKEPEVPFSLSIARLIGDVIDLHIVSPSLSLGGLRRQVAERLGTPAHSITLAKGERAFSLADNSSTVASLGIGDGMTLTAINGKAGYYYAGHYYMVTERKYRDSDDLNRAIAQEFGPDAKLGDWSHLEANPGTKDECIDFLEHVGNPWVQVRGEEKWQECNSVYEKPGRRRYFIERHDGATHGYFLIHGHLHNHLVDVGSWFDESRQILVDLGEE